MRYLDKLLGEAETKKSAWGTIQKIKKTKEKLTSRSMDAEDARDAAFGRGDEKEAYKQGDKHHNAMERSAKLSVFADKVGKKAHLKGGGKGDGKPRGKLRLVQSAFYQQVGHLIAEIRMRGFDQGTYDARHGAIKDMKTSDNAEALTGEAIKLIKKLKLKPDHPVVKNAMSTAELADVARERARRRAVRGSTPTPAEPGYKKRTKKGLPDDSSKN